MMESDPHSSGTPNLLFNLTICHRLIQQILCYFSSWFLLPFLPPFCNTSHFSILREISQSLWRKASYKNINFQVDCRKWVTHERKKRSSFFVIFLLTFLCISVKHIDVISLSWPCLFLRGQNWCQVTYWCWCEALKVTLSRVQRGHHRYRQQEAIGLCRKDSSSNKQRSIYITS